MAALSEEVKKIIIDIWPAMVATTGRDVKFNVSPKWSFRVLDDDHVILNEGDRMYTLANLRGNPQVSAIVFNGDTQRGCRIWGKAEILETGELFDSIGSETASRGVTVSHVVKVRVKEAVTF